MPLQKLDKYGIREGDPEHMTEGPEPGEGQSLATVPKRKKRHKLILERIGPGGPTFINPAAPTPKVRGEQQTEDVDVDEAVNMARDTLNFYLARIKPRLKDLGVGAEQGFAYAEPNLAQKWFPKKWQLDPDVDQFFTKLGPLANKVNKVYATGGRPSAMGYKTYTKPHIPTPPEKGLLGAWDAYQGANFNQYEDQLRKMIDSMGKISGRVPAQTYEEYKQPSMSPPSGGSKLKTPQSVPDEDLVPLATPGLYYNKKTRQTVRRVGP